MWAYLYVVACLGVAIYYSIRLSQVSSSGNTTDIAVYSTVIGVCVVGGVYVLHHKLKGRLF